MPTAQPVNGTVDVAGQDLSPTDIEVTVTASSNSNSALIEGFVDDPEEMDLNDDVTVSLNDEVVFVGNLKYATQSEDGSVSIEAYDMLVDFREMLIRLQMEQHLLPDDIVVNVLTDAVLSAKPGVVHDASSGPVTFGPGEDVSSISVAGPEPLPIYNTSSVEPEILPPGSIYVENEYMSGTTFGPGEDVSTISLSGFGSVPGSKGFVVPNDQIKVEWGTGKSGESLTSVLEELADMMLAAFWCDHRNVLRFEGFPDFKNLEVGPIIESDSGSGQEQDVQSIIVQSGASSVGGGSAAASYIASRISPKAQVEQPDNDGGSNITIQDNNIRTQRQGEARAASELINIESAQKQGELTVLGDPFYRPWDSLRIPMDLNDEIPLPAGHTYTISSVKHVVNSQDGWETTLNLAKDMVSIVDRMEGSSNTIEKYRDRIRSADNIGFEKAPPALEPVGPPFVPILTPGNDHRPPGYGGVPSSFDENE